MSQESISQNPLIGETPSETITHCMGALKWLMNADTVIDKAFGGAPNDEIQYGRFLLGECCLGALSAARAALESKEMDSPIRTGNSAND